MKFENSKFSDNIEGAFVHSYGMVTLFFNCTIHNNTSHSYGGPGGMFICWYGNSNSELYNYIIYNNNAQSPGGRGGVYIDSYKEGDSIEFQNCTI